MLLAAILTIYMSLATIYFVATTLIAKSNAESRRRRFPRYKNLYTIDYKRLTTRAIIFPVDIVRRGYIYTKWRLTSKY